MPFRVTVNKAFGDAFGGVAELADAEDLKSSGSGHVGSSPTAPTSVFLIQHPLFVCGNIEISNVLLELEHLSVTNRLSGVIYAE